MNLPHSGIVALIGRANVGKSSLMNRLLGEKVAIVSPVAQTTRNLIRGILSDERGQLVILDTPGVHKASHDLGRIMNRSARLSVEGADIALLVLDGSSRVRDEDEGWLRRLARANTPFAVALNKADLGASCESAYHECWDAIQRELAVTSTPAWFPVSATTGFGVAELADALFALLPAGPPLFPDDVLTDFPRKWTIADLIREKLFALLRDELPHAVAVQTDEIEEDGERWTIRATVLVDRPSQKGIVIGDKGRLLRKVTRQAEAELQAMYEKDITLQLWVKVEPNWARNHWILKQLGYVL